MSWRFVYNRYRYYDSSSGRYITQDPIGFAGGVNLYQYAPNPIGWIDPLGLTAAGSLHTSGTARPPLTGAAPNSIYTKSNATGTVAVQNSVYDHNGDLIGQVDFKNHGGCACFGHGHLIHPPGSAASVAPAHGPGAPHIPPADVPAEWKAIPLGMTPATPIGQ
ncbi:RHS repeat-associated core domain-containing protein [Caballeronia sp. AZ1_KS37]|uniref:RHS repeat-associated core domain-containing protein n=1 Tax=Caballeronia sp. AZ1_KS37 TaxID=2921756 RepID=UPI0032F08526